MKKTDSFHTAALIIAKDFQVEMKNMPRKISADKPIFLLNTLNETYMYASDSRLQFYLKTYYY